LKRVFVTGLGAVTPLGNAVRTTWDAAVAGRSGIDFIRSFDASGFPVRVAAEVDAPLGAVRLVLPVRHGPGEVGRGATFFFTLRPGLKLDPAAIAKPAEKIEAK
jgi:3-oxoacyl-(acyl-carrier-protein) synthase